MNEQLNHIIAQNEETLMQQSRSFAIPILQLASHFKLPVMVQYNLNKTIDTIEDNPTLTTSAKIEALKRFYQHLESGKCDPDLATKMLPITPPNEAYVFQHYAATIRLFQSLSPDERQLSFYWTKVMANGMAEFLEQTVRTIDDLNLYCYYVAGSVGLYLTDLLHLTGNNVSDKAYQALKENAVAFGNFLQKLNIIRDLYSDNQTRQRNFWPSDYLNDCPTPAEKLNKLCDETFRRDAPKAIEYFKSIPQGNDSFNYFIRFILSSGLEYWHLLKNNRTVFTKHVAKLPKYFIKSLYQRIQGLSNDEFIAYCNELYQRETHLTD